MDQAPQGGGGDPAGGQDAGLLVHGADPRHGVTQDEANLRYTLQPGALNESLSDVFGALIKQRQLGQTAGQEPKSP